MKHEHKSIIIFSVIECVELNLRNTPFKLTAFELMDTRKKRKILSTVQKNKSRNMVAGKNIVPITLLKLNRFSNKYVFSERRECRASFYGKKLDSTFFSRN